MGTLTVAVTKSRRASVEEAKEALHEDGTIVTITLPSGRVAMVSQTLDSPPCYSVRVQGGICEYSETVPYFPTPEAAIEAVLTYEED